MPTYARLNRRGFALHTHRLGDNPETRWHWPWERHRNDPDAHRRENAGSPIWIGRHNALQYHGSLLGILPDNFDDGRGSRSSNTNIRPRDLLNPLPPSHQIDASTEAFGIYGDSESRMIWNRQFGVEIECITKSNLGEEISGRGVRFREEEYNHHTRNWWKLITDSSVQLSAGQDRYEWQPRELVSPILRGTDGLEQLAKVCEALNAVGTKVNKTCGFHVHFDAADLQVGDVKRIARSWYNVQSSIDKLVSRSRRGGYYCQPLQEAEVLNIERAITKTDFYVQRYRTLNLEALKVHGTMEVRQHQGTVDYQKMFNWIAMCQHMFHTAKDRLLPVVENPQDLFHMIELPQANQDYFLARIERFENVPARSGRS